MDPAERDRLAGELREKLRASAPPEVFQKFFNSPMFDLIDEFTRVRSEPRLLVIIAHAYVELAINTMIEVVCKNGKKIASQSRDFPHSIKLTILNEMGVLSDHHYKLLDWFRKLRNDAAHDAHFELTKERLDIFADNFIHDPADLNILCTAIVFDLVMEHESTIGKVFFPDMYEETTEPVLMVERPAPKYRVPLKSDPTRISERA